jgi:FlaA1/EpsC-like NDP-sugar epimerase
VVQASGTNGGKGRTRCAAVRFGNVLGSRGSLLPTLVEQMRSGGVVTVTHPDVARFFMTIEEAVGLVLEAGRMARGGEIFVLDMGEPVRIVDLVHAFARQVHSPSVKIRFTGLRAGEKLTEVLFSTTEECAPTEHQRIYATNSSAPTSQVFTELIGLYSAAGRNDTHRVRDLLARLLPGFAPNVAQPGAAAAAPYPDDF